VRMTSAKSCSCMALSAVDATIRGAIAACRPVAHAVDLAEGRSKKAQSVTPVTGRRITASVRTHSQVVADPTHKGCVMADRDGWEKAESFSKIVAALVIPLVLGFASFYANQTLEKSKSRDELLKQAIDVVFLDKSDKMAGADKSFESRRAHRSHWLEIYNSLSDVKLSDEFIAVMMEQDAKWVEGVELYTIDNKPIQIANSERAQNTDEDELGDGWVVVGHLKSGRYSDLNFTLP